MAAHRSARFVLHVVALLAALLVPALAKAETTTRSWTDAAGAVWTETTTTESGPAAGSGADRLVGVAAATAQRGLARFGPFVVIDRTHAALVDATDAASPARFAAMLRAWPTIRVLEMVDCPGTLDDTANLALGRMIRARALSTDVPPGGSVRSGAVELFLAGQSRHAAPDADFGVHAWEDDNGRGPADYPATAPANHAYLAYYQAMGMTPHAATAFYALTNSVPNSQVRWLRGADIARFLPLD
jgi:hypothetical protein